ncbi:MAG TPA: serine/threonine-protein kinase, partial [Vicinamibacteria bacterium]
MCPRCARLPSSFTETLGPGSGEQAPAGRPDPDRPPPATSGSFRRDRTSPLLDVPLPLHTGLTFGPGESFAGRYTIVEEVGAGGMGQVYKALDRQLGRAVALKLIKPDHVARPEARERFQRELLLAQQVTHPNVCRVHDLGEVGEIRYISMEFVDGQTLEDLIHSVGHLSAKQTVALGKQICAGLGAVHDRGIVHRDLKPG